MTLCSRLRTSSREAHNISDALVNLKLGVACSDTAVWCQGLLIFQPVFEFLEDSLKNRRRDSLLGDLIVDDALFNRSEAILSDLKFHLEGRHLDQLEKVRKRPELEAYLNHLRTLEQRNPYALVAFVYHLYMGLLSGGQILAAKRNLLRKNSSRPEAVADFGDKTVARCGLK